MEIKSSNKIDMSLFGKTSPCNVYCIHVKIKDINTSAGIMIKSISDISWISKLELIPKKTFEATSKRTIAKLVNDILAKVNNNITHEFGEYLISFTAQNTLELEHLHSKIPLAELLKEKVSGNPGFDFHTESHLSNIVFGEAKYSATETPRAKALDQISEFIDLKKDQAELNVLQHFVSATAISNGVNDIKGYAAAFSLNSDNVDLIFTNALKSDVIDRLIDYPELYLIAIEV